MQSSLSFGICMVTLNKEGTKYFFAKKHTNFFGQCFLLIFKKQVFCVNFDDNKLFLGCWNCSQIPQFFRLQCKFHHFPPKAFWLHRNLLKKIPWNTKYPYSIKWGS